MHMCDGYKNPGVRDANFVVRIVHAYTLALTLQIFFTLKKHHYTVEKNNRTPLKG